MEFGEALRRRRMIRRHTGEPLEAGTLARIVAAGATAPSAGHAQGVSFVTVADPERIAAIAFGCRQADFVARGHLPWLSTAGALVAICVEPEVYRGRYAAADKDPEVLEAIPWWWVDGGAALMAILLAATAEGIGAGFQGGHACVGARSVLGLPEEVLLLGIVTLGPVAGDLPPRSARRRRPGRIHPEAW